ncbi:MAG: hypothetical protein IPH65_14385 [Dehalococcoidia bacterium]|uniref:hypothetical protein n=1 Tax=Candidatus Amarobacter glycogenicus TaxID=3140699 RepID=UPI003136A8E2|nr:hypothetical protein [Dehalococcoidia bacterium]
MKSRIWDVTGIPSSARPLERRVVAEHRLRNGNEVVAGRVEQWLAGDQAEDAPGRVRPGGRQGFIGASIGDDNRRAVRKKPAREVTALDAQRVDEDALSADFRGRRE